MEQSTEKELATITATRAANVDLLRTLLHLRIAHMYTDELILKNPNIKESIQNGSYRVTRELEVLERKILNNTDNMFPWLRNDLDKSKLWDISRIIDLMMRIGNEEKDERYEEFMALFVDTFTTIFYSQTNRTNLYFSKYKAMFQLFINEVKADVEGTSKNFVFTNGSIYLSLVKPTKEENKEQ